MSSKIEEWVERKLETAERLGRGEAGGGYPEACLVISAVLSGIASDLWPGKRIDQRRFVEMWVRYAPDDLGANLISLPALIKTLEGRDQIKSASTLRATCPETLGIGYEFIVARGEQVDLTAEGVLRLCPELETKLVREHAYSSLFYDQVRCMYSHEYKLGEFATEVPMVSPGSGMGVS